MAARGKTVKKQWKTGFAERRPDGGYGPAIDAVG
jgi:hypothetical protein